MRRRSTCGRRSAVLGTLGNGLTGALTPASHTTPDVTVFHELLAQFPRGGARGREMEVSSHGLDQGRVNGATFDIALFTNLTRDRHGCTRRWALTAQRRRSYVARPAHGRDTSSGRASSTLRAGGASVCSRTASEPRISRRRRSRSTGAGSCSTSPPWGKAKLTSIVVGAFNALNLLGVLGVLLASDVPLADAVAAIAPRRPPAACWR